MQNGKTPASPIGWGDDPLTEYLSVYQSNQLGTFANKRSQVLDLITIDKLFLKLLDGARNPKPLIPIGFFFRSHSAFRSAVAAILAGQVPEAYALLRLCLEQGSYAMFIGDDRKLWELWMDRHDSDQSRQEVRNQFSQSKITRKIIASSPELGDAFKTLCELTIDYGAHPNERGSSISSQIKHLDDGGIEFETIYLHAGGLPMDFTIRAAAQVGLWVLRASMKVYPTRTQALGMHHGIGDLCKRF